MGRGQKYSQKKRKPSVASVRMSAVLRHFYNNPKAIEIALGKPYELYAQESADDIIEMIESEVHND
jgi:hypothetical protein